MKEEKQDYEKLIQDYLEEYQRDVHLDMMNVTEMTLKIPTIKAKWCARRNLNRMALKKLKNEREDFVKNGVEELFRKMKEDNPSYTKHKAELDIKKSTRYRDLDAKIVGYESLCYFLDDCVDTVKQLGWDAKNYVDLVKLEET